MINAMEAKAIQSDWVGRVIDGRFSLLQWLGGSGHSDVFLTELPGDSPQKAAIKFMPVEAGVEARIAFAMNASRAHPQLLRVLESGRCDIDGTTYAFVVTEFAEEILSEILLIRPLDADEMRQTLVAVVEALGELHGHGLVHGRLKPSNILVVNDQLKLSSDSLQPVGAPVDDALALSIYDAPERAEGMMSPAMDMWSLGVMIFESLTQQTPNWNRANYRDIRLPESIQQPFAGIAAACLRADPTRRATLNDVRNDLGIALPMAAPTSSPACEPQAPKPVTKTQSRPVSGSEPDPRERVEPKPVGQTLPRFAFEDRHESQRNPRRGVLLVVALVLIAAVVFLWSRSHGTLPATKSNDEPTAQSTVPVPAPAPKLQPQPALPTSEATQATSPTDKQQSVVTAAPAEAAPAPAQISAGGSSGAANSSAKGSVSQRVMPNVLPSASRTINGKVNVRVRVNVSPAGEVQDAWLESAGPSRYFAKVASEAARQWKFNPARANGQPTASIWTLHFIFTRENTEVTPEQIAP
jgi:protein TonB